VMVSLPRDLWVDNPCTGGRSRINAGLNGCRDLATGAELMALMVGDFTGIRVDHVAVLDFDGFERIIDGFGGIEICTPNRLRVASGVEIPAGCNLADGRATLAWVRSRTTRELVGGSWRTMPGVSDLTRNERQQEVVLALLAKVGQYRSFANFADVAMGLRGAVALDDSLSFTNTLREVWRLRDLGRSDVNRIKIPVSNFTTSGGAMVLLPQESFTDTLLREYPELRRAARTGE
jgi:LCP family protein required for cell wall assembly